MKLTHFLSWGVILLVLAANSGCKDKKREIGIVPLQQEAVIPSVFSDELEEISHTFEIKNDTADVVEILGATTSCTCSEAKYDKSSILPGKQTLLHMVSDIRGRTGDFSSVCSVNMSSGQDCRFTLKTNIYKHLSFTPSHFYVGSVKAGEEVRRNFFLVAHSRGDDIKLSSQIVVDPKVDGMSIDLLEPELEGLPDGMNIIRFPGQFKFTASGMIGSFSCNIKASMNSAEGEYSESAKIYWTVESNYRVEPDSVFLGKKTFPEEKQEFKIIISHETAEEFSILNVVSQDLDTAKFYFNSNESKRKEHEVVVKISSKENSKKFETGSVVITIDDQERTQILVPVAIAR